MKEKLGIYCITLFTSESCPGEQDSLGNTVRGNTFSVFARGTIFTGNRIPSDTGFAEFREPFAISFSFKRSF